MDALPARDEVASPELRDGASLEAGRERGPPPLPHARGTFASAFLFWKTIGPGSGAAAPAAQMAAPADRHAVCQNAGMVDSPKANLA
jgi:hypothetical protein